MEYVISEIIQVLHGSRGRIWRNDPREITGQQVGALGVAENIQAQLLGMKVDIEMNDVALLNETRVTKDFVINLYDTGLSLYNPNNILSQMMVSTGVVCTSEFIKTNEAFQLEIDEIIIKALAAPTAEESYVYAREATEKYEQQIPLDSADSARWISDLQFEAPESRRGYHGRPDPVQQGIF